MKKRINILRKGGQFIHIEQKSESLKKTLIMEPKTIIKESRFMENNTPDKNNSKGVLEDKFQDFRRWNKGGE